MTVHVGEITSEVSVPAPDRDAAALPGADEWEERARLDAMLERVARDRYRTSTGYGDD